MINRRGGSFEAGSTVYLEVEVIEGGAAMYQWRFNGMPIDTINVHGYARPHTPRMTVYTLNGLHEGVYDLVVTNDCTQVISQPIEVDVIGTCMGDVTADGAVGIADLLTILNAWGTCPPFATCIADLTHDGMVNVADLLTVISGWGSCK